MKNTTEIDSAIETLTESAKGLMDFYEALYDESLEDFNPSDQAPSAVRSDLWMRVVVLREIIEELQNVDKT